MGLSKPQLVTPTKDWGLNWDKQYVQFTWRIWRMSNFQTYPNGKCYDEQPQALIDDYAELERAYAYERHYLQESQEK